MENTDNIINDSKTKKPISEAQKKSFKKVLSR